MQNQLIEKYEAVCKQIIEAFEKKHDCCFEFWVGKYFEAASFGDCFIFKIEDILFDLETDQPKGLIFQWANDDLEYNGALATFERQSISFRSYAMGARFGMVKQEVNTVSLPFITFPKDNNIRFRQDFSGWQNLPPDVNFYAVKEMNESIMFIADNFGIIKGNKWGLIGNYGNGAIYISTKNLPYEILEWCRNNFIDDKNKL